MEIDLKALGFTPEEVLERVVDKIAKNLAFDMYADDEGDSAYRQSKFAKAVEDKMKERMDAAIGELVDTFVPKALPEMLAEVELKESNRYGEPTGKGVPFKEYLVMKAKEYLKEEVDYDGRGKKGSDYGFRGNGTRATYMVEKYFDSRVGKELKAVVDGANEQLSEGIQGAMKLWLKDTLDKLNVSIKTKK